VRFFTSGAPDPIEADGGANPLLAFPSETPRPDPVEIPDAAPRHSVIRLQEPTSTHSYRRVWLVAGVVLALSGLTMAAIRYVPALQSRVTAPRTGLLTIDTRPAGADVLVDGERRGATPLTLTIPEGAHQVTVRYGADERVVPVTMTAGAQVSHSFELKAAEPAAALGGLSVITDPPGAPVAIDGHPRGQSPLVVTDLTPTEHTVSVTGSAGVVERTVAVVAGTTTSAMFSLPRASGPVGGWLSVTAPFDVEVAENGDVIGTSAMARIMVAAGRHDLVLSNRDVGFTESRRIDVTPGRTIAIRLDPPKVGVSINARPWAEVEVDGAAVGQTPIANLLLTVGSHEVVFRHPQLAERRQRVLVSVKGPNRIATDLTR
jgi:hypothetical protein